MTNEPVKVTVRVREDCILVDAVNEAGHGVNVRLTPDDAMALADVLTIAAEGLR